MQPTLSVGSFSSEEASRRWTGRVLLVLPKSGSAREAPDAQLGICLSDLCASFLYGVAANLGQIASVEVVILKKIVAHTDL